MFINYQGTSDDIIPHTHSEELYACASTPSDLKTLHLLHGVDHNTFPSRSVIALIKDFAQLTNIPSKPVLGISAEQLLAAQSESAVQCSPSIFGSLASSCDPREDD